MPRPRVRVDPAVEAFLASWPPPPAPERRVKQKMADGRECWAAQEAPSVTFEEALRRYNKFFADALLWMIDHGRWPECDWDRDCLGVRNAVASTGDEEAARKASEVHWIKKLLLHEAIEGQYIGAPVPRVFSDPTELDAARTAALSRGIDGVAEEVWARWHMAAEQMRLGLGPTD